jgi:AbrB family looped-hinge helix DNA binding protein
MVERRDIRTNISKGYQVVVPSDLRRTFNLEEGDEVIWTLQKGKVLARFRKKSTLTNIIGLGKSGTKASAAALKKRIQKGEL